MQIRHADRRMSDSLQNFLIGPDTQSEPGSVLGRLTAMRQASRTDGSIWTDMDRYSNDEPLN
jgi:hypothetical protein